MDRIYKRDEDGTLPAYKVLARTLAWNPPEGTEFVSQKEERIKAILGYLPSGSGWDCGTKLSDESKPDRIVLYGEFHHMNEAGYYDGWTEHSIVVTPSLAWDFDIRVTGRNRNDIKEYLAEMFYDAVAQDIPEGPEREEAIG